MARRRREKIALLLLMIAPGLLWTTLAQAAFVDVGLGARPVGLGRAFVALADDANAMLYNPAGLSHLDRMELTSMYARLYPGIEDDKLHLGYVGLVKPVKGLGTLGFGATNLWADLYGENIFYLSYARKMGNGLSLGGSFKFLRWSADGYTDPEGLSESGHSWNGWTFDVGLLYALRSEKLLRFMGADGLQLGLSVLNVNRPSTAKNGADDAKLPMGFEGGLVYMRGQYKGLLSFSRRDSMSRLHFGQELDLLAQGSRSGSASFQIRAGAFKTLSEESGGELDFGCGFALRKALLDYAYVFPLALRDVGGCHKVSIGYTF